ncbi:MAG: alpha/beta fold hydrolase [Burkholderiaceae bacterium]|nr:alpha/beta fold hydrolase [Burkholderiaceae bacterium]
MTARQLRWGLLLELLAWLGWVAWRHGADAAAGTWVAEVLLFVLGARALVVAVSFGFLLLGSGPRPAGERLGPIGLVRLALQEYLALCTLFLLVQPFESLWMRRDRLRARPSAAGEGRPPLLLIHGYQCNRGFWIWLRPRLEAAGWTVATLNVEPILGDIDAMVDGVEQRLRALRQATGAAQVILVGHSMGGLIARAYLRRFGAAQVNAVVTLGSPHYGSRLARLAWGRSGRQMVIGNPWLRSLAEEPLTVPLTSIYSLHDNQVMPQRACAELAGARAVALTGVSHLGMAFSGRCLRALLQVLEPHRPP